MKPCCENDPLACKSTKTTENNEKYTSRAGRWLFDFVAKQDRIRPHIFTQRCEPSHHSDAAAGALMNPVESAAQTELGSPKLFLFWLKM